MARPTFAQAWIASQRIYDPANSAAKVGQVIGGKVATNINSADPKVRWKNTCAMRLSYILNQAGMSIPHMPGQTVSGSDKKSYFYRVKNLISFLESRWGKAEIVKYQPSGGALSQERRG
ncbi:T6SS effector amidase Tae4 family protein [Achromobacter seleniivolatilans]|uniref:T6SS effector amidase Tae4 family protein n=1 Tax=Achromobacter seleniivolatilans TaxID=3047478 RepID=A0ABY9LV20_9BURK|nr:T6SS effector amidase Tae4 family protein [Achromobacter sp. R39]WMD18641.1 T6SS effector amidase Tae4 family protein [Achromobacter sp. R39]